MEDLIEEKALDPKMYLLRGSGSFISVWEKFIIILAIYNSIMIPWQLFYRDLGLTVFTGSTVSLIDSIIDLIFIADIIINFRTTYLDTSNSEEVTDSIRIA